MREMVFWNAGWLPVLLVSGAVFVVGVVLLARLALQNKRREASVARERSAVAQTAEPRRTVVDAQTDQPSEPLPTQIGHYRIEKKLGRGAMGEVYLGRDSETGTLAAIKTLALSQAFAPDELADARALLPRGRDGWPLASPGHRGDPRCGRRRRTRLHRHGVRGG